LPPPELEPCPTEEDPEEDAAVDPLLMDGPEEALGAPATAPEYPPDVGAMVWYDGLPPPTTPRLPKKTGADP
jgi:hypothetical protein